MIKLTYGIESAHEDGTLGTENRVYVNRDRAINRLKELLWYHNNKDSRFKYFLNEEMGVLYKIYQKEDGDPDIQAVSWLTKIEVEE